MYKVTIKFFSLCALFVCLLNKSYLLTLYHSHCEAWPLEANILFKMSYLQCRSRCVVNVRPSIFYKKGLLLQSKYVCQVVIHLSDLCHLWLAAVFSFPVSFHFPLVPTLSLILRVGVCQLRARGNKLQVRSPGGDFHDSGSWQIHRGVTDNWSISAKMLSLFVMRRLWSDLHFAHYFLILRCSPAPGW